MGLGTARAVPSGLHFNPAVPWAIEVARPFFHGTDADFDRFSLDYFGQRDDGYFGVGIYVSPKAEWAADYGSTILQVSLQIHKPFDIPSSGSCDHAALIELRQRLASLCGISPDVQPHTVLDPDYRIASLRREHPYCPGKTYTVYYVAPQPQLYL